MRAIRYLLVFSALSMGILFLAGGNCGYTKCSEVSRLEDCKGDIGGKTCAWDAATKKCADAVPPPAKTCKPKTFDCSTITAQASCGAQASVNLCEWNAAAAPAVCKAKDNTATCAAKTTEATCAMPGSPCDWK